MPKVKDLLNRSRVTLAIVLAAALASASIFATAPDPQPEALVETAWPVSTAAVEPAAQGPSFGAYGRIEAAQSAVLTSKVNARVAEVLVREGDEVVAGDVLVRLEDEDYERAVRELDAAFDAATAQVRSVQTELNLAERTHADYERMHEAASSKLKRHEELLAKRLISQSLYDDVATQASNERIRFREHEQRLRDLPNQVARAKAEATRAAAALEQAQADLAATQIRAPFNGPVLSVQTTAGQMSNVTTPLVEMADRDSIELRVLVPHMYTGRVLRYLAEGAEVQAATDAGDTLKLVRMSGQVRQGQSGIDGFFEAKRATAAIGQVVQVAIQLPVETNTIALPVESVYENNAVYRLVDDRLEAVTVERIGELGQGRSHRVLVRSDALAQGTRVLATQLPQARDGLLVAPVPST